MADLLPNEVAPALARATVESVPFWFHTFVLNRAEGIYTPGAARDHRYRVCSLPEDADCSGARVLVPPAGVAAAQHGRDPATAAPRARRDKAIGGMSGEREAVIAAHGQPAARSSARIRGWRSISSSSTTSISSRPTIRASRRRLAAEKPQ